MIRSHRLAIGAVAALSTTAVAADSVQLKPGRWTETVSADSATMGGKTIPLPRTGPQVKSVCLTTAEAADPKLYFTAVKDKDRCGTPSGTVSAGKIALVGTCTDGTPKAASEITIDGSYGGERFAAKARMTSDMEGQPMIIMLSIDGRFDGACRGDEEKHGGTAK